MRSLLISLAGLLIGFNAYSYPSPDKSWDQLRNDYQTRIEGSVFVGYGPDGIFNVCTTETEFRSINPIKVCVETVVTPPRGEAPGDSFCKRAEYRHTSQPRSYTAKECSKWESIVNEADVSHKCVEWKDVTVTMPTRHILDVYQIGGEADYLVFRRAYDIPACAQ
jgi:hypothetical protein